MQNNQEQSEEQQPRKMSKLFIGGLAWHTEEATLRQKFEEFGVVEEAVVVKDRDSGRSRGFGFVRYTNDDDAQKAINTMNNVEFDGRTIRVDHASDNGPRGGRGGGPAPYQRGGGNGNWPVQQHMGQYNPQPPFTGYPNQPYPQQPQQYARGQGAVPQYNTNPGHWQPPPYGYDGSQQQQQQQQPLQHPQQNPQPPTQGGQGY